MCSDFLLENARYKKEEMTAKEWLRPNLILVCGLPGSGKTTIARRLEQETGAIRLNIDEWVAALGVDFFDFEFRLRLESRLYEHGITLQDTVPITKELLQECWRRFQRPDEAELALFTRAVVYRR